VGIDGSQEKDSVQQKISTARSQAYKRKHVSNSSNLTLWSSLKPESGIHKTIKPANERQSHNQQWDYHSSARVSEHFQFVQ
jgi:hypothetical protein